MATTRIRRHYDRRFRRLVQRTGDAQLAVQSGVPRSTARDWLRLSTPEVVSLDVLSMSEEALQQQVVALRQRNAKLVAVLRLQDVIFRILDDTLRQRRTWREAYEAGHCYQRQNFSKDIHSSLPVMCKVMRKMYTLVTQRTSNARTTETNSHYVVSNLPLILSLNYARQGEWGKLLE